MRIKDTMKTGMVSAGKPNDLLVSYIKVLGIYYLANLFHWTVLKTNQVAICFLLLKNGEYGTF